MSNREVNARSGAAFDYDPVARQCYTQVRATDIYNYRDAKTLHPTGYLPSFVESLIQKKLLELRFLYGRDAEAAQLNGLKSSADLKPGGKSR